MMRRISKTRARVALVGLVMILLSAACGRPATSSTPTPIVPATPTVRPSGRGAGGTLRILYWQAPTILNPHLAKGAKDYDVCRVFYEPLASFDKDGRLIPILAAEIPSLENGGLAADGKSVTWKLKPGVRWSDGQPFTAQDVLFTYQFITNPQVGAVSASTYELIQDVQVMDDYTIRVIFEEVNPAWSLPFVGVQGMIIPRHVFEAYNNATAAQAPANMMPVGTGPYKVVKFRPEEVLFLGTELIETNKIIFEPNPYFREEDKPFFKRVEIKGGGTVNEAARSVLQAGEVDYAWNLQLDASQLAALEAGGAGRVLSVFGPNVERILLNRTDPNKATEDGERSSLQFPHPFFSDKRVRQAFAYAVDREAIAKLYGPAGAATSNNLVAPYDSPNTSYEYNLEKAAALLDEAGWKDSDGDGIRDKNGVAMKVVYQTTTNPLRQKTQEIVKQSLEQIGVDVELRIIDASVFFGDDPSARGHYRQFGADMEQFYDGNFTPNPGPYMQYWTCSQIPQKANNWTGEGVERWCNPAYDALYKQSTLTVDLDKRRELFIQMNDMLIEDVVLIPLIRRADVSGASRSLVGIDLTPWDSDLWNIKDWRRD